MTKVDKSVIFISAGLWLSGMSVEAGYFSLGYGVMVLAVHTLTFLLTERG